MRTHFLKMGPFQDWLTVDIHSESDYICDEHVVFKDVSNSEVVFLVFKKKCKIEVLELSDTVRR